MIAPPPRERNGRHRRAIARASEMLVALTANQPHRRGERTNVGATPWQRAIKAKRIRDRSRAGYSAGELEQAGLAFSEIREHYLRAIGAPRGFISRRGKGSDLPPSLRRKWLQQWNQVSCALAEAPTTNRIGLLQAASSAVEAHPDDDERAWGAEFTNAVSDALRCLAGHFRI